MIFYDFPELYNTCFKLAPPLNSKCPASLPSSSSFLWWCYLSLPLPLNILLRCSWNNNSNKTQLFSTLAADWNHLYQNTNPWDSSPEILIKLDLEPLYYAIQFSSIELYTKHSIMQNISQYNELVYFLYFSLSFWVHNLGKFFMHPPHSSSYWLIVWIWRNYLIFVWHFPPHL